MEDNGARERFLNSLVFNENGLVGFYYADLAAELTPTEIYSVLSLFGAERTVSIMEGLTIQTATDEAIMSGPTTMIMIKDHEGYKCVSRATCYESMNYICMSGC